MFPRSVRTALIVLCSVFGFVGMVVSPAEAVIFWGVLGLVAGVCVWLVAEDLPAIGTWFGRGLSEARRGAAAAAAVITSYLTIVGLATVFGTFAAAAVAVVVVAAWACWRFLPRPAAGPPAPRTVRQLRVPEQGPGVAGMSDDELCLAWRRSYFELQRADDEDARYGVVVRRQQYLDELERRNREGFVRWLASGARAGGDPLRYLAAGE